MVLEESKCHPPAAVKAQNVEKGTHARGKMQISHTISHSIRHNRCLFHLTLDMNVYPFISVNTPELLFTLEISDFILVFFFSLDLNWNISSAAFVINMNRTLTCCNGV